MSKRLRPIQSRRANGASNSSPRFSGNLFEQKLIQHGGLIFSSFRATLGIAALAGLEPMRPRGPAVSDVPAKALVETLAPYLRSLRACGLTVALIHTHRCLRPVRARPCSAISSK